MESTATEQGVAKSFRDKEYGYLEVLVAAFSLLACLVTIFYLIPNWIDVYSYGWPTPRTFPYTTCTIHAVLCTIWLVNALFGRNVKALSGEVIKMGITLNAIIMILCGLIFVTGYLVGGFISVAIIITLVKGPQFWLKSLMFSALITLGYYVFFKYGMKVGLPSGLLFS